MRRASSRCVAKEKRAVTSKARERCADEGRADAEGGSADPWRTEDGGSNRGRGRGRGRGAGRRARCVRRSDARERRDDGKTRRGKRRAKKGGGEPPAKRLDRRFDRADRRGTDAFHRDSMGQRVADPTRFIFLFPTGVAPSKSAAQGKPTAGAGRSPFRGDRRARALLIRTMVSPNATDDPESAEQQPEVRALSDRRVPLDERGRASPAFLVTTFSLARGAVATFRPPSPRLPPR